MPHSHCVIASSLEVDGGEHLEKKKKKEKKDKKGKKRADDSAPTDAGAAEAQLETSAGKKEKKREKKEKKKRAAEDAAVADLEAMDVDEPGASPFSTMICRCAQAAQKLRDHPFPTKRRKRKSANGNRTLHPKMLLPSTQRRRKNERLLRRKSLRRYPHLPKSRRLRMKQHPSHRRHTKRAKKKREARRRRQRRALQRRHQYHHLPRHLLLHLKMPKHSCKNIPSLSIAAQPLYPSCPSDN